MRHRRPSQRPVPFLSVSMALFAALAVPLAMGAARHAGDARVTARALYVDAKAAPGGDGSEGRPFNAVQSAADAAKPGDTVFIKAGVYRETVTPKNSGTADAPILYRPFKADAVTLSGADPVTGWAKAEGFPGNVWKAPLPGAFYKSAVNYSDQVFVDGKMVHQARWPDYGPDLSRPVKSTLTKFISKTRSADNWTTSVFEDDSLPAKPDGYFVGAEIVLQPNKDAWSWTVSGVVTEHAGKRITFKTRNDAGKDGDGKTYAVGSRYYLHNKRELLDSPGEWWHDTQAGALYLSLPAGDTPEKHRVEARRRDFGFDLDGRSYVTLQGFTLFACTATTDRQAGYGVEWDEKGDDKYPWRGKGTVAASHHVTLDRLTVLYPSHFTDMSGHFYLQWGQNTGLILSGSDSVVRNCVIRYSAGNGVSVFGRRNKVLNNLIEDVSYNQVDNAGVTTGGAADAFDIEIGHNTIRRTGRSGITPRNLRNSDLKNLVARVHHNDISHCMLQDHDGGAIYAGGDGTFTRLDHNWCHDIDGFTGSGVYPDILTNWVIDHNVCWNLEWGIHLQNNGVPEGNAICYNNTLLVKNTSGVPYGPFGFGNSANKGKGDLIVNNIVACLNPAESKGYKPVSGAFEEAEIRNNLFWDSVPGSVTDPQFANLAKFDVRLRPGSPAIDKGEKVPTVTRGGVSVPAFPDKVVGSAPDIGAYEFGGELWKAGCDPTLLGWPPKTRK